MLCSTAEIEQKRRLAEEKLLLRQQLRRAKSVSNQDAPHAPAAPIYFPRAGSLPSPHAAFDSSPRRRTSSSALRGESLDTHLKVQATCTLISASRFQVKLSRYFAAAIDAMRTVLSRSYDPESCNWSFTLEDYDLVLAKLEKLNTHLQVTKLPPWVHKKSCTKNPLACYDFSIIDDKLRNTLMPFQEESLCFAVERNGRCFLADEMGLGKTIQALAIAAYYMLDWPMLIVTTASTCANWEVTICEYMPSVPTRNIQVLGAKKDSADKPSVIITSYDMMSRHADALVASKCGVCVFDESHTLKNFKTKCFKTAASLARIAQRVILLSGTPALSKPSELFTQLQLIDESFFINFAEFSKRYCDGKMSAFGWDASGGSNLQELQIVLEQRFMIRRTKASMRALQLPEKVQEVVRLHVSEHGLDAEEKRALAALRDADFQALVRSERQILPFFHNTAKLKIPAVSAYIAKLVRAETRKIIIFGHHMNMLDAVEQVLRDACKQYIRIDGRTADREKLVHLFQTDASVACALLSITAANAGITLTAAEVVIFAELHWTPSILAQAEARAHRIGQRKPVTIRYLIGSRTVDDHIWPLLQSKQRVLSEMKLTAESYDNVRTVECGGMRQQPAITGYFSPRSDAKRRSQSSPSPLSGREAHKRVCQDQSTNSKLHSVGCAELDDDDELDNFMYNYSTQQLHAVPKSRHDPFDDDMDEIFSAIPM